MFPLNKTQSYLCPDTSSSEYLEGGVAFRHVLQFFLVLLVGVAVALGLVLAEAVYGAMK